jgi:hypothetical protein
MGTKFWKVLCDEHGTGGGGEYFGDSDAHLDPINVLCHKASGGKYVKRAVHFDLEPGVIDTVHASSLGCLFRPGILVRKTGPKTTTRSLRVLTRAQRTRVNAYPHH